MAQLEDNLRALEVRLSLTHMATLDEASRIELGFPHDFLAEDYIRDLIYGGTFDRIDNHRR